MLRQIATWLHEDAAVRLLAAENRAGKTHTEEDKHYGKDRRGFELPEEQADRGRRLATIQAAKS